MAARRRRAPQTLRIVVLERERAARVREQGLRAAGSRDSGAEIVGVQEVRALRDELPAAALRAARLAHRTSSPAREARLQRRRRCSRGASPTRSRPRSASARFDDEGRLQIARFGRLVVANVYFPNGNGNERDNSRVPYKLDFYRALFERAREAAPRAGGACS